MQHVIGTLELFSLLESDRILTRLYGEYRIGARGRVLWSRCRPLIFPPPALPFILFLRPAALFWPGFLRGLNDRKVLFFFMMSSKLRLMSVAMVEILRKIFTREESYWNVCKPEHEMVRARKRISACVTINRTQRYQRRCCRTHELDECWSVINATKVDV